MKYTTRNIVLCSFGVAVLAVTAMGPVHAQTFTVLHSFANYDGANPLAGITIDPAGNLYGTTSTAGASGFGNVYRLQSSGTNWNFSVLYSFQGLSQTSHDAAAPTSRVIIGPDGALYGTTRSGGDGNGCRELHGCGAVYKLALKGGEMGSWLESIVYRFGTFDGEDPNYGDLVFDRAGNMYGATRNGGANYSGAVYKIAQVNGTWTESVVYSFTGGADGGTPLNGPSLDASGTLYGATTAGGANGLGAVYRLEPSGASGWTESVLHSFQGGAEGTMGISGVLLDHSGNLFGATEGAGIWGGGTAYELSPLGDGSFSLSTVFGFRGYGLGGSYRTLTMDPAGNLYGTTANDGANQCGSVFKLTRSGSSWVYTSLHDFTCGRDGANPYGRLSFDAGGNIYGTAASAGGYGYGVVFQITP